MQMYIDYAYAHIYIYVLCIGTARLIDSLIRVSHTYVYIYIYVESRIYIYICICTYVFYEFAKTSLSEMIPKPDGETLGDTDCMVFGNKHQAH